MEFHTAIEWPGIGWLNCTRSVPDYARRCVIPARRRTLSVFFLAIVLAPAFGRPASDKPAGGDPKLNKLIEDLKRLDKHLPEGSDTPASLARHHLLRADLLEKIAAKAKFPDRGPWVRKLADSLSVAVQSDLAGETSAATRLANLVTKLATESPPDHRLTAYVTYRQMQAEYARDTRLVDHFDRAIKVQRAWLKRLDKFVKDFPRHEDTPDALLQAGMVCETLHEPAQAKKRYARLTRDFADVPEGAKAKGAVRRLESEGRILKLAGPTLDDPKTTFDIHQLQGKVVLVNYWAGWNSQCASHFATLKKLLQDYDGGLALVCVNLDNTAGEARSSWLTRRHPARICVRTVAWSVR